jgi:short-subunit dehydrogenase
MALPEPDPNSTCLVTGASSGIGAEIARGLARRGHGVTLAARREDRLRELADEISEEHGVRAETVSVDVSDTEARSALKSDIEGRGLTVEVLVNNAGFGSGGKFTGLDPEEEASIIRTNVAILNLASLISFQPVPFQATYGASKAAVLSHTEALHEELRGTGVTITAVCPGPVRTEFGEMGGFGGADDKIPDFVWLDADKVAEDAIDGMEKGERVVVPGALNQLAAFSGHYLPRSMLLPIVRRVWPVE